MSDLDQNTEVIDKPMEVILDLDTQYGSMRIESGEDAYYVAFTRKGDVGTAIPETATEEEQICSDSGNQAEIALREGLAHLSSPYGPIYRAMGYDMEATEHEDSSVSGGRLTIPKPARVNRFLDEHPDVFTWRIAENTGGRITPEDYTDFYAAGLFPEDVGPNTEGKDPHYLLHDGVVHGMDAPLMPTLLTDLIRKRAEFLKKKRQQATSPEEAAKIHEKEKEFAHELDNISGVVGSLLEDAESGRPSGLFNAATRLSGGVVGQGELRTTIKRYHFRHGVLPVAASIVRYRRKLRKLADSLS